MNDTIFQLGEEIVKGRKDRNKDQVSINLLDFKVGLLDALKQLAKSKLVEVFNLSNDDLFDVVKKRIRTNKQAAISLVSKSNDEKVWNTVALVVTNEDSTETSITYNDLTYEQMLELTSNNSNLLLFIEEINYLTSLLPKQLDEPTIRYIISTNNLTNIKEVMSYFKANYNGQYDSKLLSTIAKTI